MPGPLLLPLLALGGSLAGQGLSAWQSGRNVQKTIAGNMRLAEYQYGRDLDMWNRQNLYNSPTAQMERLRMAGLNPNMLYGTGSVATGNASQMPKYQAPTIDYSGQKAPVQDIPGAIRAYQDMTVSQVQVDQARSAIENMDAKTVNERIKNEVYANQAKKLGADAARINTLLPSQAEILKNEARASEHKKDIAFQELLNKRADYVIKMKQGEIQEIHVDKAKLERTFLMFRNQLAKMGITTSDNVLVRQLAQILEGEGSSYNKLIKGVKDVIPIMHLKD